MKDDRLGDELAAQIIETGDFKLQSLRKSQMLSFYALLFLGGSIILNIILGAIALNPAKPQYFAVDSNMRVTPLIPLNRPYVSDGMLTNFAAETIINTLTFGFNNYEKHLEKAKENYSPKGFSGLYKSLEVEGIFDAIEASKSNVTTSLANTVTIAKKKLVNGVVTWYVNVPIIVSYESASGKRPKLQELTAKVVIQRVHTVQSPKGVLIKQVVFKPR